MVTCGINTISGSKLQMVLGLEICLHWILIQYPELKIQMVFGFDIWLHVVSIQYPELK